MRTTSRLFVATAAAGLLALLGGGPALAHEERESAFPDGTKSVPTARAYDATRPHLVVCKPDSAARIAAMPAGPARALNEELLPKCEYEHMQEAVDAVAVRGTDIWVLPGVYREEPSWDENAPCTQSYDGGVVDYPLIVSCGEVINLVTVAGDTTPDDREVVCGPLCDLQIAGTGARMDDVVLRGGFREDGDWIKHNGIKADRADGFVLRNMTAELFRENAFYVHETDGYLLDRVNARHNDLYGILTFVSDHGVISNCDTSYNGDSGIYPGSAADVNADNPATERLTRWAVEIFGCKTHHNALGFSGTAGNSVYFHDNEVFANQAGYVTDSFVPNHPGMPQDHAWLTRNRIYANNNNYVAEFVQGEDAPCRREKPADRGHGEGTVCPAFPVPVGTGVLIAAGNRNLLEDNLIYDNWRTGVKLLWVPGAVRDDFRPDAQYDTSNGNHFVANSFGFHPAGVQQPNGRDVEWDEQGVGNCWQDNTSTYGELSSDVVLGLPDCDSGGSVSPIGNVAKTVAMAGCSTYDRNAEPDPAGCDWFDSPAQPAGRQAAPGESGGAPAGAGDDDVAATAARGGGGDATAVVAARSLPTTGGALLPAVAGLVLAGSVLRLRRRRAA
ncbi:MAG TPA: right-handed parallel beta-helix repeat-containing protein [Mycobacteriales bacterium]|nr:right-handed parallel beta-helix repeat-containing protein [Mycobacteriales bacterium]